MKHEHFSVANNDYGSISFPGQIFSPISGHFCQNICNSKQVFHFVLFQIFCRNVLILWQNVNKMSVDIQYSLYFNWTWLKFINYI